MPYPQMIEYSEAVQNPAHSFVDRELKTGTVRENALGLPLVLSGGFALTYTLSAGGHKYAVRCFHREIPSIESKYKEISRALKSLNNDYFVGFEFQHSGIVVKGKTFPIVRMDWVEGDPLGVWLDKNIDDVVALRNARIEFQKIAAYLESRGIAHGDIQNGNIMMSGLGIKLIDYDGMYVPGMPTGKGSEVGHKHFQHPLRTIATYGRTMDRFSFIVLDLSLQAIIDDKTLHKRFREGGETIIFKANDFADPGNSEIIRILKTMPGLKDGAAGLSAICLAGIDKVPTLDEFLSGRNIPRNSDQDIRLSANHKSTKYISAFAVVDALDYAAAEKHVGDRIELIGKIVEVKMGEGKYGRGRSRKYVFINFGNWRGKIVKISIWSDGLERLNNKPSSSWAGRWVSVTGLLDPPYYNRRWGYTHLSIAVHDDSQIQTIDERQALFRLNKAALASTTHNGAGGGAHSSSSPGKQTQSPTRTSAIGTNTVSKNQAILRLFTASGTQHAPAPAPARVPAPAPAPAPSIQAHVTSVQSTMASANSSSTNPSGATALFISRIPWWVWVGLLLTGLVLIGDKSSKRLGDNSVGKPPILSNVSAADRSTGGPFISISNLPSNKLTLPPRPTFTSNANPVQESSHTGEDVKAPNEGVEESVLAAQLPPLPEPALPDFSVVPPPPVVPSSGSEVEIRSFPPPLPPPIEIGRSPGGASQGKGSLLDPTGQNPPPPREDAKRIQARLIELGVLSGTADGIWGPRSRGALIAFRIANHLGEDDIWDEVTQAKMFGDKAGQADRRKR